jgi:phosphoribosylformimino-5-aminoimidazole carboxamide ribotide isomerase
VHIIPVLDIKDGLVVRARMGHRDSYKPIETPLSPTASVRDVADGLRTVYPFPAFYVADLDRIERRCEHSALKQLRPLLPTENIWLDAGFSEPEQLDTALAMDRIFPVLGSESQSDISVLQAFCTNPRLILSLDFRGDEFLGPPSVLENAQSWPPLVIVMTLGRIGANAGPDFDRLSAIKRRAGNRAVIAAGGIRGLRDIEQLEKLGISAALVATALHNGSLTPEAISSLMQNDNILSG